MTAKQPLRARLRTARMKFCLGCPQRPEAPTAFKDRLFEGAVVATYSPIEDEADPYHFDLAVLATAGDLALPHIVDRATPLRFLHHPRNAPLVRGPYGLMQPPAGAREVTPDIILTPLVGFDRRGNRLGQGAGHYDRAFARHPHAWRVGIAWSVQEVDALTPDAWPDPWDVPLHAIATETEWITP